MDFIQRLVHYFAVVRRKARQHRRLVTTIAAAVVFATTYALILPAITLDDETADQTPGISLEQPTAEEDEGEVEPGAEQGVAFESDAETAVEDTSAAEGQASAAELQASTDDGRYDVAVSYGKDAQLAEGATLRVTELTGDEYDAARAKVVEAKQAAGEDTDSLGIAAIDVSILDASGTEVEPAEGAKVDVRISAKDVIPEEADANTVEVQHLNDQTGTVDTVAVASAPTDDSKVDVADADATADFDVSSFSTYVVTWNSVTGGTGSTTGISSESDLSSLDGKTYVVAIASKGAALTATTHSDHSDRLVATSVSPSGTKLGLSDDSAAVYWKFERVSDTSNQFYVESVSKDGTGTGSYLNISNSGVSVSTTRQAITLSVGSGSYAGMVRLVGSNSQAVNLFGGTLSSGFGHYNDSRANEWFTLYSLGDVTNTTTVTFDANGGSVDAPVSQSGIVGTTITLPSYSGTKDGYTFLGWSTKSSLERTPSYVPVYEAGTTYTLTDADVTLYAAWGTTTQREAVYYIRLDGTIPFEPSSYAASAYTSGITSGYIKTAKWIVDNDVTKPIADNGSGNYVVNDVSNDLTQLPTNAQIVEVLNAQTSTTGLTVAEQDNEIVVTVITENSPYAGKFSVGDKLYVLWYVQKLQQVDASHPEGVWHIDGSLLVKSKVSVAYDGNPPAGAGTVSNVPLGYQETVGTNITVGASGSKGGTQLTPTLAGYTFLGWTKDSPDYDGTQKLYQNGDTYQLNQNTTFYAQWSKGKNYITVKKTNEAGTVLAGARFRLYEQQSNGSFAEFGSEGTTNDNGTYTFTNVSSQTVYRMDESYAPNGYETRNSFYFKVTTGDNDQILNLYETDESGKKLSDEEKHSWIQTAYSSTSTSGGSGAFTITIKDEQIKRQVKFVKTAADGTTTLSGAIFTLKSGDADVTGVLKTEASGTDGVFSVDDATLPYGTYTLTETAAPTNYEKNGPITITLNDPSGNAATTDGTYTTGTGMTFSGDDAANASVSMTRTTSNEDNMATTTYAYTVTIKDDSYTNVTVKKVANDADGNRTTTALTGATFTLTRRNDSGNYEVPSPAISGLGTDGSFTISSEDGFTLSNLPAGTYKLKETAAPAGYVVLTDDIYFSVSAGTVTFTDSTGKALTTTNTYPADVSGTTVTVGNTAGKALPETGGAGTLPYALAGSALITSAIVGFALRRRNEGRGV